MYSQLRTTKKKDDDNENKIPDFTISLDQLKKTIANNLNFDLSNEILEIIFYALKIPFVEDTKIDFLLFFKIYYLIYTKIYAVEEEGEGEAEAEGEAQGEEQIQQGENYEGNEGGEEGEIEQDQDHEPEHEQMLESQGGEEEMNAEKEE